MTTRKLLEEFETFEDDLKVEQILKKVKAERVQDKSLAEQLEKREQRGGVWLFKAHVPWRMGTIEMWTIRLIWMILFLEQKKKTGANIFILFYFLPKEHNMGCNTRWLKQLQF